MKKLRKAVFKELVSYLAQTNVARSSNHPQGFNGEVRKLQKTCYKRRLKKTIRATLNHFFIYEFRKHPLYNGIHGTAIVLPERSRG